MTPGDGGEVKFREAKEKFVGQWERDFFVNALQGHGRQYLARRRAGRDVPAELSAKDARAWNQRRRPRTENARRVTTQSDEYQVMPPLEQAAAEGDSHERNREPSRRRRHTQDSSSGSRRPPAVGRTPVASARRTSSVRSAASVAGPVAGRRRCGAFVLRRRAFQRARDDEKSARRADHARDRSAVHVHAQSDVPGTRGDTARVCDVLRLAHDADRAGSYSSW